MLVIAHRAGNSVNETLAAIDAGADLVEADVRYYRGRLELRHKKALGPRLLWDYPWELSSRDAVDVPTVEQILPALRDGGHIMLDLKGTRPAMPRRLARVLLDARVPVAVCTRRWWMLDAFAGNPRVRLVLSAGNSWELRRLLATLRRHPHHWPGRRRAYGVSVRHTLLTPRIVAELQRDVEVVMAWSLDTQAALDHARRLGVTGLISKNIRVLGAAEPAVTP